MYVPFGGGDTLPLPILAVPVLEFSQSVSGNNVDRLESVRTSETWIISQGEQGDHTLIFP